MGSKTDGARNIAIGQDALSASVSGYDNVAIGYDALKSLAGTKYRNIAIGSDALKTDTQGHDNIAIGAYTLNNADSASTTQTIAIGPYAASGALAGYGNIFIGYYTGNIATSAFENTMVGRSAGAGLTTGDYNTCVGAYAGKQTNAIEGGVYNVFLGYKTRGTHPSHSQAIAIGSDIDAAPGEVAIGTSAMGKVHCTFQTNATWSRTSDVRLKQNISDSTLGLDFISSLRPVTYNWKPNNELPTEFPMYREENEKDTNTKMTGLIAQELKTAIDSSSFSEFDAWGTDNDGIQQVRDGLLIFPLINAVKELKTKLEAAEAKIKALEEA